MITFALLTLFVSPILAQELTLPLLGADSRFWEEGSYDIFTRDGYTYLANRIDGIRIVDTHDPLQPEVVGRVGIYAQDIACDNNLLAVNCNREEVVLYNLDDPLLPQQLCRIDPDMYVLDLDLDGDRLIVSARSLDDSDDWHLLLFDLAAPDEPVLLANYLADHYCTSLDLEENVLLVANGNSGLVCYDLSNPAEPVIRRTEINGGSDLGYMKDVMLFGDLACLGLASTFALIDLNSMQVTATLTGLPGSKVLHQQNGTVYMSWGSGARRLAALDLTDPAAPFISADYVSTELYYDRFQLVGENAYLAAEEDGLQVISLAEPGEVQTQAGLSHLGLRDYLRLGEYAVYLQFAGLTIVDLHDPAAPVHVASCPSFNASRMLEHEGYVYVLRLMEDYISVFDLRDPAHPVSLDRIDLEGRRQSAIPFVWQDYLVYPTGSQIRFYDLQDPANISLAHSWELEAGQPIQIAAAGDKLIYNSCNPFALWMLEQQGAGYQATMLLDEFLGDWEIHGNLLYVRDTNGELSVASLDGLPDENLQLHPLPNVRVSVNHGPLMLGDELLLSLCDSPEPEADELELHFYDNRDYSAPVFIGTAHLPVTAWNLQLHDDCLFVNEYPRLALYDVSQINVSVEAPRDTPAGFELLSCAPNPFNPSTTLSFRCAQAGLVEVAVYDLMGRRVTELAHREFAAGEHQLQWDGRDTRGVPVASGTYFMMARFPDGARVLPVSLMK